MKGYVWNGGFGRKVGDLWHESNSWKYTAD